MTTETIIISFIDAFKVFKDLDLHSKRQKDSGKSDYEIVQDILYHQRIELVKLETVEDPELAVSFILKSVFLIWSEYLDQRFKFLRLYCKILKQIARLLNQRSDENGRHELRQYKP